jgi:hypothetical protein
MIDVLYYESMAFYDLKKAELLRTSSGRNDWPERVKLLEKLELVYFNNLSFQFDFSSIHSSHIIRYYGMNATFYEVHPQTDEEKPIDSQYVFSYAFTAKDRIYDVLVSKKQPVSMNTSPTEIFESLLKIGVRAIRKIVTPGYAREHLKYGAAEDQIIDFAHEQRILRRIHNERERRLHFVLDMFDDDSRYGEFGFFLVDSEGGHDTLLAHCFLKYYPAVPMLVEIKRVASFYPGACKRLSTGVADALLADGKIYVYLQSINTAAHVCYLRSYLGRFKYAVLIHKGMSLIDESNIDTWLKVNSDASVSSGFIFHSSIYMYYIRDSGVLLLIAGHRHFAWNESGSILRIYCKLDTNAAGAVDIFLAKNAGRRVLYIPNEEELRNRIPPKRQKMTISEEEEEEMPRSNKERAE